MTLRRSLAGTLILLGALAVPAVAQPNATSLDGHWTGRTSRGGMVAFKIDAGTVRTLEIDWKLYLDAVCPGRTGSAPSRGAIERGDIFFFHPAVRGSEPPPIRFPAFKVSRDVEALDLAVTMVLAGNFSSESAVGGDVTLTVAGCAGQETFSWKASRKAESAGW
ncbi:MAG: hypothetical protein R2882_08235 [Gemmatimonadales bacterium]